MNRGAVAAIAIAVLLVAIFMAMTDPTRNGQHMAMGVGLFASIVVLIGIIMEVGGDWGGSQRNVHQEMHIHPAAAPHNQPQIHPAYFQPPASPQIIMMPSPAPAPAAPQIVMVTPEMLAQMQAQGYLPRQPAAALPAQQYRGALDVAAEPVRYAPPQLQIRRGAVAQLESPQASLVRRVARRLVG